MNLSFRPRRNAKKRKKTSNRSPQLQKNGSNRFQNFWSQIEVQVACVDSQETSWIGSRNPTWQTLPNSSRLTYLSVYDNRDGASEPTPSPSPPSSLTHVHRIQSHTLPTPTLLTIMCTQVLCCLARLARPRASGVTMRPDTRLTILSTRATQCIRGV